MFRYGLLGVLALSLAWGVAAQDAAGVRPALEITGVWARATAQSADATHMGHGGGSTSAVYLQMTNPTAEDITLVSAESAVAGVVELHESRMENDVMQMRPVEGGIVVPAEGEATLQPGGLHIMLLDLQQPLVLETAFMLTLTFSIDGQDELLSYPLAVPVLEEAPASIEGLRISQIWARPTATRAMQPEATPAAGAMNHSGHQMGGAASNGVSAVYMLLSNTSEQDLTLVGVETVLAEVVEIHETRMNDQGVMQMRPIDGQQLTIPAGESVELRPAGLHVMLMSLQDELYNGEALFIVLNFADGTSVPAAVPIVESFDMLN